MTSPNVTVNRKPKRRRGVGEPRDHSAGSLPSGRCLSSSARSSVRPTTSSSGAASRPRDCRRLQRRTKASEREIKVEFQSGDGFVHYTWVTVDHDQHPVVGEEVTVVYRESDPGNATVLGYESDGVFFRGAGVVLTAHFWGIGVFLFIITCWRQGKTAGSARDSASVSPER